MRAALADAGLPVGDIKEVVLQRGHPLLLRDPTENAAFEVHGGVVLTISES
jgi:hypothetical protein